MNNLKKCSKCGKELPATNEYFYKKSRNKDGLNTMCRQCMGGKYVKLAKPGYKICSKCERELPSTREFFHIGRRNIGGLMPICKECRGFSFGIPKEVIIPKIGYKICAKCKRELPTNIGYFDKCSYKRDGFNIYCKECRGRKFKHIPKDGFRICSKCNTELSIDNFYLRKNGRYDGTCRKCKALSGKKRHHIRKSRTKKVLCSFTTKEWTDCINHFNNRCAYCGEKTELTQDHFIPLFSGGNYTVDNIIPACSSCNSSKNNKDFFEWYPKQTFYSMKREQKILEYLNKNYNLEAIV